MGDPPVETWSALFIAENDGETPGAILVALRFPQLDPLQALHHPILGTLTWDNKKRRLDFQVDLVHDRTLRIYFLFSFPYNR